MLPPESFCKRLGHKTCVLSLEPKGTCRMLVPKEFIEVNAGTCIYPDLHEHPSYTSAMIFAGRATFESKVFSRGGGYEMFLFAVITKSFFCGQVTKCFFCGHYEKFLLRSTTPTKNFGFWCCPQRACSKDLFTRRVCLVLRRRAHVACWCQKNSSR